MNRTLATAHALPGRSGRLSRRWHARAALSVAAIATTAACSDTAVPFFDAPTTVPTSTTGVQNAVTGLFSGARTDVTEYVRLAGSYGRDMLWFISAAPVEVTIAGGLTPVSPGNFAFNNAWDNEYRQAKEANTIVASLAKVPAYSPAQAAAITGVVQTVKALMFMMLAETRDTLGIPLYTIVNNPAAAPYCNKDVWAYIVALLDSANTSLNAAGPIPLPVVLPPGFAAVGQTASPSTAQGSFAAFNRALAGKAGLELAYAIARNSVSTHPTPASPGNPDVNALTRADSALTHSALYNPAVIAPPVAGPFPLDAFGVYHNFSGQAGDQQNGVFTAYFNFDALWDLQNDVDTLNDLRWKNKFVPDLNPVQVAQYAGVSDARNYLPYSTVSSPIPIVRAEELALVRAQIRLGLGDLAGATALINLVHQQAGGFTTPLTIPQTYTAVRDSLLKEQRISTVEEASGDRMIALRMYHLEAVADTTWQARSGPDAVVVAGLGGPSVVTDYHTTVSPIPVNEYTARGGAYVPQCP